jgi:hypothetical protein
MHIEDCGVTVRREVDLGLWPEEFAFSLLTTSVLALGPNRKHRYQTMDPISWCQTIRA